MKIRFGFVSNSSSSSFVIGTASQLCPAPRLKLGNPQDAINWLKSKAHLTKFGVFSGSIFMDSNEVDLRWENNQVVEYEGCCDYCYGPFREWTEEEFLIEFRYSEFVFSND